MRDAESRTRFLGYRVESYKLVVFVPTADRSRLLDALAEAGAGGIGAYDRCAWWSSGTGTIPSASQ